MASRALTHRFTRAVSSCARSISTVHKSPASLASISICSPSARRKSLPVLDTRIIEVSDLRTERLLAREGQQLVGQIGRPQDGLGYLIEALRQLGGTDILLFLKRVGVGEDHEENIVEIMRDAAGELADSLHLLRLAQLSFCHRTGAFCDRTGGSRQPDERFSPRKRSVTSVAVARYAGRPSRSIGRSVITTSMIVPSFL